MRREQKPEDIKKIASVWDWNSRPSIMANDRTLRLSQSATKSRSVRSQIPSGMQIFKEKK